jgi:hypothetical protein
MVTDLRRCHIGECTRNDIPDDDALGRGSSLCVEQRVRKSHTAQSSRDAHTTHETYADATLLMPWEEWAEPRNWLRKQRVDRLDPSCRPLNLADGGERMRKAAREAPFTSPSAALLTSNSRTFIRFIARSAAASSRWA